MTFDLVSCGSPVGVSPVGEAAMEDLSSAAVVEEGTWRVLPISVMVRALRERNGGKYEF